MAELAAGCPQVGLFRWPLCVLWRLWGGGRDRGLHKPRRFQQPSSGASLVSAASPSYLHCLPRSLCWGSGSTSGKPPGHHHGAGAFRLLARSVASRGQQQPAYHNGPRPGELCLVVASESGLHSLAGLCSGHRCVGSQAHELCPQPPGKRPFFLHSSSAVWSSEREPKKLSPRPSAPGTLGRAAADNTVPGAPRPFSTSARPRVGQWPVLAREGTPGL